MKKNLILPCLFLAAITAHAGVARAQEARDPVDIAQFPARPAVVPPAVPTTRPVESAKTAAPVPPQRPTANADDDADVITSSEPDEMPHRLPPLAAYESAEQQQRAQAVQNRAIAQDDAARGTSGADFGAWGEEPVYEPHFISVDIPDDSVAAPAVESAPAARSGTTTTTTVGATPPKVGSKPKGGSGTKSR